MPKYVFIKINDNDNDKLKQAILECEEAAERLSKDCETGACGMEHYCIMNWLKELLARRTNQPFKKHYEVMTLDFALDHIKNDVLPNADEEVKREHLELQSWLEELKQLRNNDTKIKDSGKTFYHLSEKELNKPLTPRIPKSDFEEQETPRVCVSSSIQGCLIGINENKDIKGKTFKVYSITTSNYKKPSIKEVADRDITDEYWILEEVKPKYEYDIKIIGKERSKKEKINGETFEVPTWKYEKIK